MSHSPGQEEGEEGEREREGEREKRGRIRGGGRTLQHNIPYQCTVLLYNRGNS
jgi:hypothetical protein